MESARSAKGFDRPRVSAFVVTQDVKIAVIGEDAEEGSAGRIPFIVEALDGIRAATDGETQWTLVRAMAGITFHLNSIHEFPAPHGLPMRLNQRARDSAL